eukprot:10832665-Prorocentrum_lima.AAC.1
MAVAAAASARGQRGPARCPCMGNSAVGTHQGHHCAVAKTRRICVASAVPRAGVHMLICAR